mgnify:CR=1 FL=1
MHRLILLAVCSPVTDDPAPLAVTPQANAPASVATGFEDDEPTRMFDGHEPPTTEIKLPAGDEEAEDDPGGEPHVEAEREVKHDEDDGDGDAVARAVTQLLAGLRADPLDAERRLRDGVGARLAAFHPRLTVIELFREEQRMVAPVAVAAAPAPPLCANLEKSSCSSISMWFSS